MSEFPFVLVDGSSYLFRAYHALPPLTNSKGEPTGAIVGVINMLRKLIDEYQPQYVGVVFDTPGKTFRDDLYDQYKANRPPTPEDLKSQIKPLYEIIKAMGLPLLLVEGVEADDVIGTLASKASASGMKTLVSTGDKDMAQLVDDHVTLINTMSDTIMDRQGVYEKFSVWPEQIIDYLALMGDKVDNIPGVNKCGPKTAAKWLEEHQTLENVMANADSVKGKVGEYLREALDFLPLSRTLTTIKCDVDMELAPQDLTPAEPDADRLRELYTAIESNRLLQSLDDQPGSAVDQAARVEINSEYETVLDVDQLDSWLEKLRQAGLFAFDTETTSLNYREAELVGLSFSCEAGKAAYVPVGHNYPGAPEQLGLQLVLEKLRPLLEDPALKKVGQHLKYDRHIMQRYGIELQGVAFDTMLESYVLDSTATRHNMDALADKYLGYQTVHFEDIAGKGAKQLTFNQIELELAGHYAAEDADITLRLHQALWPKLQQEPSLAALLTDLEMPLSGVLTRIEANGVRIEPVLLKKQGEQLAVEMHELEQKSYEIAGRPFNMGSPKQIGQIFFEELALPVVAKTPKGVPSTAENVLQELADMGHELPALILRHRSLSKLKSTYIDTLPKMIDPQSGRVHTSYHQAVAATGRLSSSDPNLQNIPVRTEEGRRIRKAFIPADGHVMVAADYSQIELRIMAHLSGDAGLLKAFAEGMDVHRATAAEVFGADSLDAVTDDQRRSAKAVNFGLIYGMSAFGLAKQLGIGRAEAQGYVDLYFDRYPGVRDFMDRTRQQAHEQGYVETLFGRRLYLPEINSRNGMRRQAAERTAINAPMQGTAADIIKRAMLAVDSWILADKPQLKMLMQVHDELVFEIHQDALQDSISKIKQLMEGAAELKVPLVVDVGTGANWEEAH